MENFILLAVLFTSVSILGLLVWSVHTLYSAVFKILPALDGINAKLASVNDRTDSVSDQIINSLDSVRDVTTSMVAATRGFTKQMTRLDRSVELMAGRIDRRMDKENSMKVIRRALTVEAPAEIIDVIQELLRENDFTNRRDYVSAKITRSINTILFQTQEHILSFPLTIDPSVFFPMMNGQSVLTPLIWNSVEPLFLMHTPVRQRIEEMRTIVHGILSDHMSTSSANASLFTKNSRDHEDTDVIAGVASS
jgi:hypothetical protein